jgi:hypothetical protein
MGVLPRLLLGLSLYAGGWGLFFSAPPQVTSDAMDLDPVATQSGLSVRLGAQADGWIIEVHDDPTAPTAALVRMRSPAGETLEERSVVLAGTTDEERSRELAAELALVIEQHDRQRTAPPKPTPKPKPAPPPEPVEPRGLLAVSARAGVGLARAVDVDAGVDLRGGAYLVREHVVPLASIGWSRSSAGPLTFDAIRFGIGAAFGAPLARGRLWLGAGVLPQAMWARAAERRVAAAWWSSTEVSAQLHVRLRWFLILLRTGVDLTFPPAVARGTDERIRWGPVRFAAGLGIGAVFGGGRAPRFRSRM